jgi:hypothetical protein
MKICSGKNKQKTKKGGEGMKHKIDNAQLKKGYFLEKVIIVGPEDPGVEGPDYWMGYSVYEDEEKNVYMRYWSTSEKECCPMTGEFKNCNKCENRYQGPEKNRQCLKSTLLKLENGKVVEVFLV